MNDRTYLRVLRSWAGAIAVTQLMNGTIETALSPHYPALRSGLHIGLAAWGAVLSGIPVGLLAGASLGGWIVHRLGSRVAVVGGSIVFFASASLVGAMPTAALAWTMLFLMAAGNGALDVGWGLQATNFELLHQHESRWGDANLVFQALFSLGSLLGVASATLALVMRWGTVKHMAVVGGVAMIAVLVTVRAMHPHPEREPHPERREERAGADALHPRWTFVGMCAASLFSLVPVGVAYAWAAPYALDLGARGALVTAGLIAFTACEGFGRWLAGKWRALRVNKRRTVRLGGALALAGGLLVVLAPDAETATAGFGLISLGLGPVTPILQTEINRAAEVHRRTLSMTIFTNSGYLGGTIGQALIGPLAAVISLRTAMAVPAVCAVAVLACGRLLPAAGSPPKPVVPPR